MLLELLQDSNKKIGERERENEKISTSIAKQLLKNLIEEIPKVEDLDDDTMSSEMLFDNLESAILDLLSSYFETVRGPSKSIFYFFDFLGKFLAENMIPFLLTYMSELHKKASSSIQYQLADTK